MQSPVLLSSSTAFVFNVRFPSRASFFVLRLQADGKVTVTLLVAIS